MILPLFSQGVCMPIICTNSREKISYCKKMFVSFLFLFLLCRPLFAEVCLSESYLYESDLQPYLKTIEQKYQHCLAAGPGNEWYDFHSYMLILIQHPIIVWEVKQIMGDIFAVFDSYWDLFRKFSRKNPHERASVHLRERILPLLQTVDRQKMINCLLLGLFGIGDLENVDDYRSIQDLVVETALKKKIAADVWANEADTIALLHRKLEEEKLKKLLQICEASQDSLLYHTIPSQFNSVSTINEYMQKYDLYGLKSLGMFLLDPETPAEREAGEIYDDFVKKVDELKVEYGSFIDLS